MTDTHDDAHQHIVCYSILLPACLSIIYIDYDDYTNDRPHHTPCHTHLLFALPNS